VLQTRKTPFGTKIGDITIWPTFSKYQNIAMVSELIVVVILLYVPIFNEVFDTAPVAAKHWGIAFAFSFGLIVLSEIRKWLCYLYPEGFFDRWAW
jgi:sodium/potassium-transporting ATPase subunit alpha